MTCRARSSASATLRANASPLTEGTIFRFDTNETEGGAERVFLPHPQIFEAVEPGHTLLLDDGKIRMTVIDKNRAGIEAKVVVGGTLASRKGISLPDTVLPIGPLTEKDKKDLDFALRARRRLGCPVVRSARRRRKAGAAARRPGGWLMSKIEKPAAIADLDNIVAHSDGLMVARGDLGVELPVERVPGLQKQIVSKARAAGKPVVVATQMLESMISSPVPTRAEVSDVATAVFDGADAVMLSARVGRRVSFRSKRSEPWTVSPSRPRTIRATALSCTPRALRRRQQRRRHCRRRAHHCRHAQAGGHPLLHGDGVDGFARRA